MLAQIEVQDTLLVFAIALPRTLFLQSAGSSSYLQKIWQNNEWKLVIFYTQILCSSQTQGQHKQDLHTLQVRLFAMFHIPISKAHNSYLKTRNNLGHNGSRITFPKISCNSNNDNLDSSLLSTHITRYNSSSFYIKSHVFQYFTDIFAVYFHDLSTNQAK